MSEEVLKQIQEKHSQLSEQEQNLLAEIVATYKTGKQRELEEAKYKFLDLLEQDLNLFFAWDTESAKRFAVRNKFLGIAGLYHIIPHQEILAMLHRVYFKIKRPISDLLVEDVRNGLCELDAVQLKHCEPLRDFLATVEKTVQMNYLDYISGDREKGVKPIVNWIIFDKNIAEHTSEEKYLSASSETLTKSIFISTHNQNGEARDWIGIAYDLVTQAAFIDFFHSLKDDFKINKVLRNSVISGTRFLEGMVTWFETQKSTEVHSKLSQHLAKSSQEENSAQFLKNFLAYMESDLMNHNLNLVSQLNDKLGLAKDDYKIHV